MTLVAKGLIAVLRSFANAPKTHSVDVVQGNNLCLFSDPYKTHCMGRT